MATEKKWTVARVGGTVRKGQTTTILLKTSAGRSFSVDMPNGEFKRFLAEQEFKTHKDLLNRLVSVDEKGMEFAMLGPMTDAEMEHKKYAPPPRPKEMLASRRTSMHVDTAQVASDVVSALVAAGYKASKQSPWEFSVDIDGDVYSFYEIATDSHYLKDTITYRESTTRSTLDVWVDFQKDGKVDAHSIISFCRSMSDPKSHYKAPKDGTHEASSYLSERNKGPQRRCEMVEANDKQWYLLVGGIIENGEDQSSTAYGPFASLSDVEAALRTMLPTQTLVTTVFNSKMSPPENAVLPGESAGKTQVAHRRVARPQRKRVAEGEGEAQPVTQVVEYPADYKDHEETVKDYLEANAEPDEDGDYSDRDRSWAETAAYEDEWENYIFAFGEMLKDVNPSEVAWLIEGQNLDWRSRSGSMVLRTNDPEKVTRALAPTNTDFHIRVTREGGVLNVWLAHHDVPTGSTITMVPAANIQSLVTEVENTLMALFGDGEEYALEVKSDYTGQVSNPVGRYYWWELMLMEQNPYWTPIELPEGLRSETGIGGNYVYIDERMEASEVKAKLDALVAFAKTLVDTEPQDEGGEHEASAKRQTKTKRTSHISHTDWSKFVLGASPSTPCTSAHTTFQGRCLNCGYDPKFQKEMTERMQDKAPGSVRLPYTNKSNMRASDSHSARRTKAEPVATVLAAALQDMLDMVSASDVQHFLAKGGETVLAAALQSMLDMVSSSDLRNFLTKSGESAWYGETLGKARKALVRYREYVEGEKPMKD